MPFRCAGKVKVRQSFAVWSSQREMRNTRAGKVKHNREDTVEVLLASDISGAGLRNSCGLWFRQAGEEKRTAD